MRVRSYTLLLSGGALLLLSAFAQKSEQELPAAPSTTIEHKNPPAPAKASKPLDLPPVEPVSQHSQPSSTASHSAAVPAQGHAAQATLLDEEEPSATIRKSVNEVNVVFTVTDKHGHYVKDLKKDDFKVIDNNRPAEEIRSFQNEANLPLLVGLLIDASNSIRGRFKFEQESAVEFLSGTIRASYDKAFVLGFDVTPEVTQDFTDDTEALSHGVRQLRPGGGTALFDALYFACRDKLLKEPHAGPVRKAIILLSDGDDNQSHVTREEAIDMAERAEVIVYTISTNLTGSGGSGDKVLERIANTTGGRAFAPFQLSDVANAFAQIQDELRSQYALSYKPADFKLDGGYRSIEILAKNHKGLHVRSRRGYYAPTE